MTPSARALRMRVLVTAVESDVQSKAFRELRRTQQLENGADRQNA